MSDDAELERFHAEQRAANRRKVMIGLGVASGVIAAASTGLLLVSPGPCRQVADRFCASAGEADCRALRTALEQVGTEQRCNQALTELDAAEALDVSLRLALQTRVLHDLMGTPPELQAELNEAARAVMAPFAELERSGQLGESGRRSLLAAPPAACHLILGKLASGPDFMREPLHGVLVELNHGTDLGPTADVWGGWCRERTASERQR